MLRKIKRLDQPTNHLGLNYRRCDISCNSYLDTYIHICRGLWNNKNIKKEKKLLYVLLPLLSTATHVSLSSCKYFMSCCRKYYLCIWSAISNDCNINWTARSPPSVIIPWSINAFPRICPLVICPKNLVLLQDWKRQKILSVHLCCCSLKLESLYLLGKDLSQEYMKICLCTLHLLSQWF